MPPPTIPFVQNRKHLARAQRELILRRWILAGAGLTVALALGFVLYGWVRETRIVPFQPVATVDGEPIPTRAFQGRVRLARLDLISRAENLRQLQAFFGSDPSLASRLQSDLLQIALQLSQPETLGRAVLDGMIEDLLIRREAARRGIVISPEQVERRLEESFGYYRDGTPTPAPTAEGAAPAATATAEGPTPTAGPTATAVPTATPYTAEAYRADFDAQMRLLGDVARITADDYRARTEALLYREALQAALAEEIAEVQEQTHARHLLLASRETAEQARARLQDGESWEQVASELSLDQATAGQGGDLGWFPRGVMDEAFEQAAFSQAVGVVGEPLQSSHGWHVIEVLARATRPLEVGVRESLVRAALARWLSDARAEAAIEIAPDLADRIPLEPQVDLERLLSS